MSDLEYLDCVQSGVLVRKMAPDFTAAAVMADGSINNSFNFMQHIGGKYSLLFFYPLDFTFVCPSELIAFHNRINEFTSRNVEVVGVSIDSEFVHSAWRNTAINKGGIGSVAYPLVADKTHEICRNYGVQFEEAGVALRANFLIDKDGIVRHQVVNDLPLGRNIDEALRMIDALQFTEAHGEVCPAGWNKNQQGMKPSSAGVADYLANNAQKL